MPVQRKSERGWQGAVVLLALAAGLGCETAYAPQPEAVTGAAIDEASQVVRDAAERRDDIRLVEGGLLLEAFFYEWTEREVWEEPDLGLAGELGLPPRYYRVRERTLVGPRAVYVPLRDVTEVRVRVWPLGSGVEIALDGEPEPAFLTTADRAEAERLAGALDLLRRARRPPLPEAAP